MGITVRTTPKSRISINSGTTKKLIVNTARAAGSLNPIDTIVELRDVDATEIHQHETLVYEESTGKFVVEELPDIDGGTF